MAKDDDDLIPDVIPDEKKPIGEPGDEVDWDEEDEDKDFKRAS